MADVLIDGSPVRTQERAVGPNKDLDAPASVVSDYFAPVSGQHLPQMLLATTVVAVLPLTVSLGLRASGLISGWVSVGLAVIMSLVSSTAGSTYWRKRGRNTEVLFGELLLWGWIRSRRQERELANATRLLSLVNTGSGQREQGGELTVEQHEHLLQQLAGALEGQDVYLNGHSRRVARHATMIARGMGLSNEEVARVRAAAAVHDVGKLRTPKAILNKPGRLTDEEFAVIKRHPVDGAEMVAALGDPELTRIVRHHHERLDGAGYPDRLRGEEIPLGARIIAVADTFDAITSARPYRDAAPHQKAIDILRKEAGTQLDPDAVRSFLAYYSGSRPTAMWAIITSSLRRVVSWLSGDPAAAAAISAGKVAAATAATAAIGAAAGAAPIPVVHHTPARPVVSHVHGVPARPRSTGVGSGRHSVLVLATLPPNGAAAAKASTARPRQRNAHAATAGRHQAKSGAGNRAKRRAGGDGGGQGSHAHKGAAGRSSSVTGATPNPGTSSSAGATRRTAASLRAPAAPSRTSESPPRAAVNQSQGSNAYGHGKGEAKAHGHSSQSPAESSNGGSATRPARTVVTPSPSPNINAQGNDGVSAHGISAGSGNANGDIANGSSQGTSNSSAQAHASGQADPTVITSPTQGGAGTQGTAAGHGGGDGQGNGLGHGG